jgi:hypothetical protein
VAGQRYAILDDNQCALEERLARLRAVLPGMIGGRVAAAMVIGSVAAGEARDGSDIDLVLVLGAGAPCRADYTWWEAEVRPHLPAAKGFPVEPLFIGRGALTTTEPHLREALRTGIPLWDPEGLFGDQSAARA